MKANIGLIGLAVMGENLALNMESKGFTVAVYNRSVPGEEGVVDRFINGRGKSKRFIGTHSIEQLVDSVKSPHIIMMMVKAGHPVDELISQLLPFLSSGDVIVDGGNSDFHDTERRVKELEKKGIYFVGTGISGVLRYSRTALTTLSPKYTTRILSPLPCRTLISRAGRDMSSTLSARHSLIRNPA